MVDLVKIKGVDFFSLLVLISGVEDCFWLFYSDQVYGNGLIFEDQFLVDVELMVVLDNYVLISCSIEIINIDCSVCVCLVGEIVQCYGNCGFKGQFDFIFWGVVGQSFGVFLVQGMQVCLEGEVNDYVGKGMNSGCIILVLLDGCVFLGDQVIFGNICFYGVIGGELFVYGWVGECFGVCNSGVCMVVEGVGDYCCEYMIGGVVVVFGSIGCNVGVGMIGGVIFLLDEEGCVVFWVNLEIVEVCIIIIYEQELMLKVLFEWYVVFMGSEKVFVFLVDWFVVKGCFKVLVFFSEWEVMGLVDK